MALYQFQRYKYNRFDAVYIILMASQLVYNSLSIIKVYEISLCPAIYPMKSILAPCLFILYIHRDIDSNVSKHKTHPNPHKTILKQHILRLQKEKMDQIQYPQSYRPIPVLCGNSPIFWISLVSIFCETYLVPGCCPFNAGNPFPTLSCIFSRVLLDQNVKKVHSDWYTAHWFQSNELPNNPNGFSVIPLNDVHPQESDC